jgi:hypothetical protein
MGYNYTFSWNRSDDNQSHKIQIEYNKKKDYVCLTLLNIHNIKALDIVKENTLFPFLTKYRIYMVCDDVVHNIPYINLKEEAISIYNALCESSKVDNMFEVK